MKTKRHIVIPDMQIRQDSDTEHLLWIARFIRDHRLPNHIQFLGDWWDMPSLSRWTKSSDLSAEGRRIVGDLECGRVAMRKLFDELERLGVPVPEETDWRLLASDELSYGFCHGNHDKPRVERAIEAHKELEGLLDPDTCFGLQDFPLLVTDFMEPLHVDGVTYCHLFDINANGDTTGRHSGQPTAAAQVRRVRGSSVAGHKQGYDVAHLTHPYARPWEQETFAVIAGSGYPKTQKEKYRGPTDGYERRGIVVIDDLNGWGLGSPRFIPMEYLERHYGR